MRQLGMHHPLEHLYKILQGFEFLIVFQIKIINNQKKYIFL